MEVVVSRLRFIADCSSRDCFAFQGVDVLRMFLCNLASSSLAKVATTEADV